MLLNFRIYSRDLHNLLTITFRRINWVVTRIQRNFNYDANYTNKVFYIYLYVLFYFNNMYYFRIMLQKVF